MEGICKASFHYTGFCPSVFNFSAAAQAPSLACDALCESEHDALVAAMEVRVFFLQCSVLVSHAASCVCTFDAIDSEVFENRHCKARMGHRGVHFH